MQKVKESIPGKGDVDIGATGGSQTIEIDEEDDVTNLEIKAFDICSVYCVKYLIWRKI